MKVEYGVCFGCIPLDAVRGGGGACGSSRAASTSFSLRVVRRRVSRRLRGFHDNKNGAANLRLCSLVALFLQTVGSGRGLMARPFTDTLGPVSAPGSVGGFV